MPWSSSLECRTGTRSGTRSPIGHPSGADQSLVKDSLAGDGVLAPERLPEPIIAVEPSGNREQALDGGDVCLALRHRIETAGIGEGVEVERAFVAVVPDLP